MPIKNIQSFEIFYTQKYSAEIKSCDPNAAFLENRYSFIKWNLPENDIAGS